MGTNTITCTCGGPVECAAHAHDECESCGSDEGVKGGLCYDCDADEAEYEANQDWDY